MGYGPLVRATTGVTRLWTSAGDPGFYDATTIFPDHVCARITAIAALAALIGRDHTGTGAHVHISQAEAAVNQLAASYVTDAARTARLPVADERQSCTASTRARATTSGVSSRCDPPAIAKRWPPSMGADFPRSRRSSTRFRVDVATGQGRRRGHASASGCARRRR